MNNLSPAVIIQTVQIAKEYLDNELAKYKSLEEMTTAGKNTHGEIEKLFTQNPHMKQLFDSDS